MVVDLYMHEDNLLLRTVRISVLPCTALVAVAKILVGPPWLNVVVGALGIAICGSRRAMVFSNKVHHDLRTFRAREMEAKIGRMGTFNDEMAVSWYEKPLQVRDLQMPDKPQVFKPVPLGPGVLVTAEYLPILVVLAWLGFIVALLTKP